MAISFQSDEDVLRNLREKFRKMSDQELNLLSIQLLLTEKDKR